MKVYGVKIEIDAGLLEERTGEAWFTSDPGLEHIREKGGIIIASEDWNQFFAAVRVAAATKRGAFLKARREVSSVVPVKSGTWRYRRAERQGFPWHWVDTMSCLTR